ncbi:MAG: cytochrome c biogenesis protein CcsA [Chlorobi bacterium]|nr:cytochrome c biogenesis protein CcsA [Chlorobiota bacterium]
MNNAIHILSVATTVFYFITFLLYLNNFFKERKAFETIKRTFLFFTLVIHIVYLVERSVYFDHLPITTPFEIFSLLAFAIAFIYFLIEIMTDIKGTGVFILLFAFIFQTKSALFSADKFNVSSVLNNYPLGSHVITAILGLTGMSIAFAYSLMYFLLYKNIKSNKFSTIFNRLPNLEILEKLSFYSITIGLFLLTVSIIIGFIWLPSAFKDFSYFDPKILSTMMTWLIYAALIILKLSGSLSGKRFSFYSMIAFVVSIALIMSSAMFKSSFHDFLT